MKIKFTEQKKLEIVKEANNTKNKKDVAAKYQIHLSTIYSWKSKMENPKNRNEHLSIKLSLKQKNDLVERCKRLGYENDISGYVRRILFGKYIATENPKDLREQLYKSVGELNKIGNNINQIAHYSNYLKNKDLSDDKIPEDLEKHAEKFRILIIEHKDHINSTIKKIYDN